MTRKAAKKSPPPAPAKYAEVWALRILSTVTQRQFASAAFKRKVIAPELVIAEQLEALLWEAGEAICGLCRTHKNAERNAGAFVLWYHPTTSDAVGGFCLAGGLYERFGLLPRGEQGAP